MLKRFYTAFCFSLIALSAAYPNAPQGNAAHGTDTMVISCMDYRLRKEIPRFMQAVYPKKIYDEIVLPGAGLSESFDGGKWHKTLIDSIDLGIRLHGVKKVIFIDHKDCGAYKAQYKKNLMAELDAAEQKLLDSEKDQKALTAEVQAALKKFIENKNKFSEKETQMHQEIFKKIRHVLKEKFKALKVETYVMPIKNGEHTEKCHKSGDSCNLIKTNHVVKTAPGDLHGHGHGHVKRMIEHFEKKQRGEN